MLNHRFLRAKSTIFFLLSLSMVLIAGCEQSNPEDVLARNGDIVNFAGRKWNIKSSTSQVGPGPNYFSKRYSDVWVDDKGFLHMSIAKHDGIWYSSEVISQDNLGYGKYSFTIQGNPMQFAKNVVLGLFTWDDSTFVSDGNSEVDIEFSRWGSADNVNPTTFSVQPLSNGINFPERTYSASIDSSEIIGVSTHEFIWTDTLITWRSFRGDRNSGQPDFAQWSFNLNHPPRIKREGDLFSLPIVIPAPGLTTNARINFWTLSFDANGPSNGLEHEIVIRDFYYEPSH